MWNYGSALQTSQACFYPVIFHHSRQDVTLCVILETNYKKVRKLPSGCYVCLQWREEKIFVGGNKKLCFPGHGLYRVAGRTFNLGQMRRLFLAVGWLGGIGFFLSNFGKENDVFTYDFIQPVDGVADWIITQSRVNFSGLPVLVIQRAADMLQRDSGLRQPTCRRSSQVVDVDVIQSSRRADSPPGLVNIPQSFAKFGFGWKDIIVSRLPG